MKILCDRQQLLDAFGVATGIVPLKTPKAIAKNVLVQAENDQLTIFATDFEMSARIQLESVKVKQPGSALLPAKETHSLLREINDPTVTLESEEFRCTLTSGGGSFVLVGDDPAEFPQQIQLEDGVRISVSAQRLASLIRKTLFAAAKDESRYAINGLLLEVKDDQLRAVGTDGRRLALNYEAIEGTPKPASMIVPARALQALSRAISESERDDVEIVFSSKQAGFQMGQAGAPTQVLLVSQLIDSQFPDYEAVLPKAVETTVEIHRDLLESNLRRVAVLTSGELRLVRFNFNSSYLELSAESAGVGRADVKMDVDVKGPGVSIGFNPDFVLEALKVTELDTIRLDLTDEETPAKFSLGESFAYVLMPISSS